MTVFKGGKAKVGANAWGWGGRRGACSFGDAPAARAQVPGRAERGVGRRRATHTVKPRTPTLCTTRARGDVSPFFALSHTMSSPLETRPAAPMRPLIPAERQKQSALSRDSSGPFRASHSCPFLF